MAIYGIGATHSHDVSDKFILNGKACVGWDINDAPALYELLRFIKTGDIIYIKSTPIGQGLRVKAVGIVVDNTIINDPNLGNGVSVNWIWNGHINLGTIKDKYNVRNNTLYEECNKEVQKQVLDLLLSKIVI